MTFHDHGYKTAQSKIFLITDQFFYLKNPLQKNKYFWKNLENFRKNIYLKNPLQNVKNLFFEKIE